MRIIARSARRAWRRLRFRAWVARLRFELARKGGRLRIEAAPGIAFDSAPAIKSIPAGDGHGLLTLRIGPNVRLGRHMTLEVWARADNILELGEDTEFLSGVRIVLRGGSVRLGPECLIKDGAWIKADGELVAGHKVTVGQHAALHCTRQIELDDLVGLGERVSVLDSDHPFEGDDVHYTLKPLNTTPVRIGRNSMIAVGSVILRGARIGRNSVVSANSVVRDGEYPSRSVIAGNPAKVIKTLDRSPEAVVADGDDLAEHLSR